MKIKKIGFSVLLLCILTVNACSFHNTSVTAEKKQSLTFAEKLAAAPINQSIVITGETPFGSDLSFLVAEPYTSGLGTICRQVMEENANIIFAVCFKNDFEVMEQSGWILIPAL